MTPKPKPPKLPKRLGRPITLAEPLATLARDLGGIPQLREALGGVSQSTIHRWSDKLAAGLPLHTLTQRAIDALKISTEAKRAQPNP
jgi:hypothetical protein